MAFIKTQEDERYADYEYYIPDHNKCGLTIRITIVKEKDSAYMVVTGDTEDEGHLFSEDIDLPSPEWALAITGHKEA